MEFLLLVLIIVLIPSLVEIFLVVSGILFSKIKIKHFFSKTFAKGDVAIVIPYCDEDPPIFETLNSLDKVKGGIKIGVALYGSCKRVRKECEKEGILIVAEEEHKNLAIRLSFEYFSNEKCLCVSLILPGTLVSSHFLKGIYSGFGRGYGALQLEIRERKLGVELLEPFSITCCHHVRKMGLNFWGLSVGFSEEGVVIRRDMIKKSLYQLHHERFHRDFIRDGAKVGYVPGAYLTSFQKDTKGTSWTIWKENVYEMLNLIVRGKWQLMEPFAAYVRFPDRMIFLSLTILFFSGFIIFSFFGIALMSLYLFLLFYQEKINPFTREIMSAFFCNNKKRIFSFLKRRDEDFWVRYSGKIR